MNGEKKLKNNEIQVFYLRRFVQIKKTKPDRVVKRFIVWTDSFSAILLLRLCCAVYLKMKNSTATATESYGEKELCKHNTQFFAVCVYVYARAHT